MQRYLNPKTTEVLEDLFDGVCVLDCDKKIVFWNRGAEQITGYSRKRALGLKCSEGPLRHTAKKAGGLCGHEQAMKSGNPWVEVIYLTGETSCQIPLETHIRAIKNEENQVIGTVEVFRDISHWKAMEDLSREKDTVMGILAHDLRTPLSVIQIYAKLLNHDPETHIRDMSEPILRRSQYALALVDQLLDAKSIESGMPNIHLEPLDIGFALEKCRANFAAAAEAKEIQLRLVSPATAVTVSMDPVRFEEVFNNLIANAINYSFPKTEIALTITEEAQGIWIKVQDQGMGISLDDQAKLFKPFGKTHNRPTGGEGTHGLGLYIVKKIVELFKGNIRLESEPGQGTAIFIYLPYQQTTA